MKAHVHSCAFTAAAALVWLRFTQSRVNEQVAELTAERCDPTSVHKFEGTWVDWRSWIVSRNSEQMLT